MPNPTNADVIAYYVQAPNTTVDTLAPLKFNWANKSPTYLQGSGSLVYALPTLFSPHSTGAACMDLQ